MYERFSLCAFLKTHLANVQDKQFDLREFFRFDFPCHKKSLTAEKTIYDF